MALRDATEGAGIDVEPQPLPPIGSLVMTRALQLATDYLGVEEEPRGSNRGVDVDRFVAGPTGRYSYLVPPKPGQRGIPWCGRFAAWCIESAAIELDLLNPLQGAGDLASALKWRRWAASAGKLRQGPKPGYVGLYLHGDSTGHVVLVADVTGEYIVTREGNASQGVRCRLRVTAGLQAWVEVG